MWKVTHFVVKYFPLTIATFTVMFVLLCLNLYYFLNLFYCTNVTKEKELESVAELEEVRLFSSDFLLRLGLIVL